MPLNCLAFLLLGLLASVTIDDTFSQVATAATSSNTTNETTANIATISFTTGTIDINTNSITSSATYQTGSESPTPKMSTGSTEKTTSTTKRTDNHKDKTTAAPSFTNDDRTGIIILFSIILMAIALTVGCYLARRRGRQRYSVDLSSRLDEANIPLSTMAPDDAAPHNGLQTFEGTKTAANEPKEPEAGLAVEDEQKAEDIKTVIDPSTESAAPPAPPTDTPEDKVDVADQSPPAPVEPSVVEKTDDEGVDSSKTSVESLKESNESNPDVTKQTVKRRFLDPRFDVVQIDRSDITPGELYRREGLSENPD